MSYDLLFKRFDLSKLRYASSTEKSEIEKQPADISGVNHVIYVG